MKIAILYIGLGRYSVFWKDFYKSSEKFFLKNHEKKYFVFTDNENIEYENNLNVKKIHQEPLKFPLGSLMRFDMFLNIEDELKNYDYIFFFNANMEFVSDVSEECLPTEENDGLVMGLHPGFYNNTPDTYTYERNPESTAYIAEGEGKYYFQGCLNGGTKAAYLELCKTCDKTIKKDLTKNIIAIWWDESHLNKYMLDKKALILPPNYLYPEGWNLPDYKKDIKIIQRDKSNPKYGGLNWLRGLTEKKASTKEKILYLLGKK